MPGVTMVKFKESMLSVTIGKYSIFFLQQYSNLCNHKMQFLTDAGGLQGAGSKYDSVFTSFIDGCQ